ncbi:MAG: hypothetical protein AAGA54_00390 [Myxococcota bacterium]
MSTPSGLHFVPGPGSDAEQRDFVRLRQEGDCSVVTCAHAMQDCFGSLWPAGSSAMLDAFDACWRSRDPGSADGLECAFEAAGSAFRQCAALHRAETDDGGLGGTPVGLLLAAVVRGRAVSVHWNGVDTAALLREGQVVMQTEPLTLRGEVRDQIGHGGETLPDIITGGFRLGSERERPPRSTTFEARSGDVVAVVKHPRLDGPCLEPEAVAPIVAASSSLQAAAVEVVRRALDDASRTRRSGLAVLLEVGHP